MSEFEKRNPGIVVPAHRFDPIHFRLWATDENIELLVAQCHRDDSERIRHRFMEFVR